VKLVTLLRSGALKWLWLSVLIIILDQATKLMATHFLAYHQPVSVMPSFNLMLTHNSGAAFSFLSQSGGWQRWFFSIIALTVCAVIVVWMKRLQANQSWLAISLALILGGALGNLWDRLWLGYVVDFIQWYYQSFYWPTFNVADSAISVGAVMMIIDAFKHKGERVD